MKKFRKGAASFYIVAFSTLILVIIAASFAAVIISAVTRASNDDLSQSAYDAAMAGVEDAKLAFSNYRRCVGSVAIDPENDPDSGINCGNIVWWMENPDCDMVGHILGRIGKHDSGEVVISDTTEDTGDGATATNEAYTCVMIKTVLDDYRSTLTSTNQVRVVKVEFNGNGGAEKIGKVQFSWYSHREDAQYAYLNMVRSDDGLLSKSSNGYRVAFQSALNTQVATPPTIELQLVQTAENFQLTDFDRTRDGGKTDRATMYLVPTAEKSVASGSAEKNYTGVFKDGKNVINAGQIAKTNDWYISNVPFVTYCPVPPAADATGEFACSVELELPEPVGGSRSNDTFMFVVTLPYGQPDTDFALEFYCKDGEKCSDAINTDTQVVNQEVARINGAQVTIDSTGRANDLYRRVEVRLESANTAFPYPYYAIQLLGDGGETLLEKDMTVESEYNFYK